MQETTTNYIHLGLIGGAVISVLVGLVLLVAAIAFEGYIAGLMVMALGGCCYAAARELKKKAATADTPAPADVPSERKPDTTGDNP